MDLVTTNRLFTYNSNNSLAAIKWNSAMSKSSFLRTNLYLTDYNLEVFELFSVTSIDEFDIEK